MSFKNGKRRANLKQIPASITSRVELEADLYDITPVQMIQIWRGKWQEMRAGLAPILAQRRARLLAIKLASSEDELQGVIGQV